MSGPSLYASALEFCGVAKEATPGTPVAPTNSFPWETFEAEDKPTWIEDTARRGAMVEVYDLIEGPIHSELSFGGPAFIDTLGFWLGNILGDVATTGVAAPFTHAISTLNTAPGQPTTHTITDWQGITTTSGARAYAGVVLTELGIKWSAEGVVTFDAKALAWPSAAAAATPTKQFGTVAAQAAWRMAVGVGGPASGASQIKNVLSGELTIKRKAAAKFTAQNSQNPYAIVRGPVSVDGKMSFVAADESPLTNMLSNTQPQVQWLLANGANLSLQVNMQKCAYKTSKRTNSAEDMEWEADLQGLGNSTDAGASGGFSPVKVTLINAMPSGTYV